MPALLFAAAALAAATPPPEPCAKPGPVLTAEAATAPRTLQQEPPAALYLAVDRRIDRCPAPLVVRTGIGGSGK